MESGKYPVLKESIVSDNIDKSFEAYGEDVFIPAERPYSLAQVLDSDYFPENTKITHAHK